MNKIFIIVLHFGDEAVTNQCLKSIFNTRLDFEQLIIVDNSRNFILSEDLKNKNKIKIIQNKENLGFAGGVNVGIKIALSDNANYILLLNNDTFVKEDFLKKLIGFSNQFENAGIVAPAIKFKKNGKVIYDIGGKINKLFGRTTHEEVHRIQNKNEKIVDYVSGCCMLIKNDAFKNIGLFDERFFLYYEDVDFCLRAKDRGFLTYVVPGVYIEHELSKSVGKVSSLAVYHQTKSALLFGKKHFRNAIFLNRVFIITQTLYFLIKKPKVGISAIKAFKYI